MVAHNPDSNGKNPVPKQFEGHVGTGRKVAKDVRDLRRRVCDLKMVLANAITPEEVHEIARGIIDLALAGNRDAATWIMDRVIGKPTKSIEITELSATSDEPPKVMLLDWRRNVESAPESN